MWIKCKITITAKKLFVLSGEIIVVQSLFLRKITFYCKSTSYTTLQLNPKIRIHFTIHNRYYEYDTIKENLLFPQVKEI